MADSWIGLFAAAGMDPAISERLTAAISKLLKTPEIATRMRAPGSDFAFADGSALAWQLTTDLDTFAEVIREAGLKCERMVLVK